MEPLRFRPASEIRDTAERAVANHSKSISRLVPDAEIVHIGATAIEGSLTKGDVDLLVRVPVEGFSAAVAALRSSYTVHQADNWTPTFASFKDDARGELPIGIQAAVKGSDEDITFLALLELLRSRPDLVEKYDDLKRRHEGGDEDAYLEEKAAFFDRLRPLLAASPRS